MPVLPSRKSGIEAAEKPSACAISCKVTYNSCLAGEPGVMSACSIAAAAAGDGCDDVALGAAAAAAPAGVAAQAEAAARAAALAVRKEGT